MSLFVLQAICGAQEMCR